MTHRAARPPDRQLVWLALGAMAIVGLVGASALRRRPDTGAADSAPGRTARQNRFGGFAVTGRTVTIHRSRDDIYAFWRDFRNLPPVMEEVSEVIDRGEGVTRWVIRAPAGMTVSADTRVVSDRPGEEIAWRSVEGSQIETEGRVSFRAAPADRGTEVEVIVAYRPPMGEFGRMAGKLTGAEPQAQSRRAMKRLKMLLETGEIATARNRNDPPHDAAS